ncbi:Pathogenesis-related thaumatin superfamily protein [Striga hermonthica]|uniref:Pathogenesis-related thaumatin superfamily protein n=1 Tax=Striga hermonthica TaxID=68872 RepID=A0A9N7NZ55_STRHE|nr:Pathogenesis-related thaumatin superfamily protein [Striga hermonthica]
MLSAYSSSSSSHTLYTTFIFLLLANDTFATTFTLVNKCEYTIWPGILSNSGVSSLGTTGFELGPHDSRSFQAQPGWSGRFWARTGCSFDTSTGQGQCLTGDCGSGQVECGGSGAAPPATLAEFTVGSGGPDFYDVSLVDGYNLPVVVEPAGGSGQCGLTGCAADLGRSCPEELRAGGGRGCRSACEAFGSPEYCCRGEYGSPETCRPTAYSEAFKSACPRAYSYAYDDASSTFTCSGADYTIVFCPSRTSLKSSRDSLSSQSRQEAASGTVDNSNSPAEDDFLSWLPDFGSGSSSKSNYFITFGSIIFLLFLFL